MGIHVSLGEALHQQVKDFAQPPRNLSISEVIRIALGRLFATECPDPKQDTALKIALGRHFSIPKVFPTRSFFIMLYKLSEQYPDSSSKAFWGSVVYISGIDKTHRQVYEEIQDESDRLLQQGS